MAWDGGSCRQRPTIAKLMLTGHPRLLKLAFYGAAAYRTYLATYNLEMMRRAPETRPATIR
jgi:hypothetical protein